MPILKSDRGRRRMCHPFDFYEISRSPFECAFGLQLTRLAADGPVSVLLFPGRPARNSSCPVRWSALVVSGTWTRNLDSSCPLQPAPSLTALPTATLSVHMCTAMLEALHRQSLSPCLEAFDVQPRHCANCINYDGAHSPWGLTSHR